MKVHDSTKQTEPFPLRTSISTDPEDNARGLAGQNVQNLYLSAPGSLVTKHLAMKARFTKIGNLGIALGNCSLTLEQVSFINTKSSSTFRKFAPTSFGTYNNTVSDNTDGPVSISDNIA